jgi:hypothetical protein
MNKVECLEFLVWLKNRLVHKYHETDNDIIDKLDHIIDTKWSFNKSITVEQLENICRKRFIDFDMEKDESDSINIGYTKKQKEDLKQNVFDIIEDFCILH